MVKIIHIIGRLSYGGAERLLLDLCRKINKSEFEISVAVLQDDNPMKEQFEQAGVKLKFFDKKKLDFRIIRSLAKYLKDEKPDIVHTHLFAGDFWGGKAAELAGIKNTICTKHDVLFEGFWRNYLGSRERRKFKKIVAISEATREHLIKAEKIELGKIEVIYNGVDVNKFYSTDAKIFSENKITIGSVGRLSKEKGYKHLIRACRFLKSKEWELILVGDGPKKEELEDLVRFLSLEDKVHFIGLVKDVRPFLNKFDVFVLPSVSEGLSLAILEAALAGKFIIATDVGGIPEIIKHKETGLLFKPKNIEQLVQHLNWVIDHAEEAKKMAVKLQKQVMDKFDISKVMQQYEELYERVESEK